MLYVFFLDKPNLPDVYQSALNESARLGRDDYEAYAKMDYAKMTNSRGEPQGIPKSFAIESSFV